jgi:hypothetical protein
MPPITQPIKKANRSNSIFSTHLGFDIEFTFNVVLNQAVLDHGNQITAAIFWHYKPYWASTPTTGLQEGGIETSVILVVGVKSH